MKNLLITLAVVACVAASASAALQIIAPDAVGAVYGTYGGYFPMANAFDDQPTALVGGVAPIYYLASGSDAPYYQNRYGWIDFGENWENLRISYTYTQYRTWSIGQQIGYDTALWSNNDYSVYPGLNNGPAAEDVVDTTGITFNSAVVDTGSTTPWHLDNDFSAAPIAPAARRLYLHFAADGTNRAEEYCIVGEYVPEPATMTLLGLGGIAALIRRRR